MSVGKRFSPYSGIRMDIPHIKSIESSISYDFDSVLRGVITGLNRPYIVRGFDVVIPESSVSATALEVKVADSVILHSSAAEAGTVLSVGPNEASQQLSPQNSKVRGAFQNGVINYIGLEYVRYVDPNTVDQTAGWSQSQQTEFQRTAPIGQILDYRFVISTSGFGSNLPLYIVGVSSTGTVQYITNAKDSLFRLGKGGTNPNPQYVFNYKNLANPQNPASPRTEWVNESTTLTTNPVTVAPGDDANAFLFGDFAITNMKDWMDAVMSRLREITNSSYWYTDSVLLEKAPNVYDVWWDSVGSVMTGSGNLSYNMILESSQITYGGFQSKLTDAEIVSGDSYVIGITSGNKATIQNFNLSQLIVNSLTKQDFVYDEILQNRRIYRPNLTNFNLDDAVVASNRIAVLSRRHLSSSSTVAVTSWSYAPLPVTSFGSRITLNVASHSFVVGDFIYTTGLDCADNQPNGTYAVKAVTPTTIVFDVLAIPVGAESVSGATASKDTKIKHPYLPMTKITEWSFIGTDITVTAPQHAFTTGDYIVVQGLHANVDGIHQITVNADKTIDFSVTTAPSGTPVVTSDSYIKADSATFYFTVEGATPEIYNKTEVTAYALDECSIYYVLGSSTLPAQPNASGAISLDGVVALTTVANPTRIQQISYDDTPTVLTGSCVINSDVLTVTSTTLLAPNMTVSGTGMAPSTTILQILDSTTVKLSSQALSTSSGSYTFASPFIEVECFVPHGFNTIAGPIDFTVYGDQMLSPYITSYSNVSLIYISANIFRLVGPTIFDAGTYTNTGTDATFARSPNNPYAGPVAWDSDIVIKGIIGDRAFTIKQSSIAEGTDTANKFNVNGQTGTVYLLDGEVAYITLERDQVVAGNANFSTAGGISPVIGVSPLTDINGDMLRVGDFLRFDGESENFWYKISNIGYPSLVDGDRLPVGTTTVYLVSDNGQQTTSAQRPSKSGRLHYCRGTYDTITVKKHWQVKQSADVYWLAVRRDNGSLKSKVYLKALELEAGESRAINDNEPTNLLTYTGAGTEAAINPNYTVSDATGSYKYTQDLTIGTFDTDVNVKTRTITFQSGPELGFSIGDKIGYNTGSIVHYFQVESILTSKTVVFKDDVALLTPNLTVQYYRTNYVVKDTDNLTLATRKEDRELARVNTSLMRPVYDESIFPVLIELTPNTLGPTVSTDPSDPLNADQIMSGSYIYLGTNPNNPSALAWVVHGTKTLAERIEGVLVGMPGGKFTENKILVHVISGVFPHNALVIQAGRTGVTRQVVNPTSAAFKSTIIKGTDNVELVLPPNKRTQIVGSEYVVWPANCSYKASTEAQYSGEELMVIANDQIREANIDFLESFGGPKGKIQIVRDMPLNTRFRFRIMPAYGSALAKIAGNVTLQVAYDGGNQVGILTGRPVLLNSIDRAVAFKVNGTIELDSVLSGNVVGGIVPATNKAFDIGSESLKVNKTWTSELAVKSHDSYPLSAWKHVTSAGTSVGTSGVLLPWTLELPLDYAIRLKVEAIARRSDGTFGVAGFELHGTFYRTGAGLFSAGDAYTLSTGSAGDGHDYAITFGKVGTDIVLVAYGNGVVEWGVSVSYQMIKQPA